MLQYILHYESNSVERLGSRVHDIQNSGSWQLHDVRVLRSCDSRGTVVWLLNEDRVRDFNQSVSLEIAKLMGCLLCD